MINLTGDLLGLAEANYNFMCKTIDQVKHTPENE